MNYVTFGKSHPPVFKLNAKLKGSIRNFKPSSRKILIMMTEIKHSINKALAILDRKNNHFGPAKKKFNNFLTITVFFREKQYFYSMPC